MPTYYPIFLNIKGKNCVVIGGGDVAERKAKVLAEHGAVVTVISSRICNRMARLEEEGAVRVLLRDYQTGDLEDATVVVAATDDPAVNEQVSREGRLERALINVVDSPELSDFIVPSLLRRGDISIAISTSGKSPALSRKIRTELEKSFPPEYSSLALLISEVRSELRESGANTDSEAWQEGLDLDLLLEMLKRGEYKQAREKLLSNLKKG